MTDTMQGKEGERLFTPEPWYFDEGAIYDAHDECVAQIFYQASFLGRPNCDQEEIDRMNAESDANGHLLKEAPRLYRALLALVEQIKKDGFDNKEDYWALTNSASEILRAALKEAQS